MALDPALEWLLADAKSLGLTVSEYEERFGVILEAPNQNIPYPAEHAIRRHEVPAGLVTDGDIAVSTSKARRRSRR